MKQKLLVGLICFLFYLPAQSQINADAVGLRLGGGNLFMGEVSYQHRLSQVNRLEFDLGFGTASDENRLYLVGSYHWVWNIVHALNWYVGPAASVSLKTNKTDTYFNIGLGGQIGLEYDFSKSSKNIPILISIDTRPVVDFFSTGGSQLAWGAAIAIRYVW